MDDSKDLQEIKKHLESIQQRLTSVESRIGIHPLNNKLNRDFRTRRIRLSAGPLIEKQREKLLHKCEKAGVNLKLTDWTIVADVKLEPGKKDRLIDYYYFKTSCYRSMNEVIKSLEPSFIHAKNNKTKAEDTEEDKDKNDIEEEDEEYVFNDGDIVIVNGLECVFKQFSTKDPTKCIIKFKSGKRRTVSLDIVKLK